MIKKPKGTYDVYGDYGKKVLYLENIWQMLMEKYNYEYIRTPVFEASEVFLRGVGEGTDIVSKETYNFLDRGKREMTLRPEGTAAVVRSFIENKMTNRPQEPIKLWYFAPMFRYERPQSGRFREHYQFGVEVLKGECPLIDAEVISIAVNFFKILGLKGIKVNINTLGDQESRAQYNQVLVSYLEKNKEKLSAESKKRLTKNPLRILDSKEAEDQPIIKDAPKIKDYLNEESQAFFNKLKTYLNYLEITYQEKDNLVRGLDYYTHTVFEIEADIEGFGSQNVLCGGGRYDGLVETLGGPPTKGIGFGLGIERLITALDYEKINIVFDEIDAYVASLSSNEALYAFRLANDLRMNGFRVDFDLIGRNIKNIFKNSERLKAKFVILIGEDEIKKDEFTIKNNKTKEEYKVNSQYIVSFLEEKLGEVDVEI